jgi:hypothetical protein
MSLGFQKGSYPVRLASGVVRFGIPLGIYRFTIPPWADDIEDTMYTERRGTQEIKMLPIDTDTNASSGAIMKGGSASLFLFPNMIS